MCRVAVGSALAAVLLACSARADFVGNVRSDGGLMQGQTAGEAGEKEALRLDEAEGRQDGAEGGEGGNLPSLFKAIKEALVAQLSVSHRQWMNALVAFVFGLLLLVSSGLAFQLLVVAATAILAMLLATYEMNTRSGLGYSNAISIVVSLEAGLTAALLAHRGMDGVMVLIGALDGAAVAQGGRRAFSFLGYAAWETHQWLLFIWYSSFVLAGIAMIVKKKHRMLLGVGSAAVGSLLVSSAIFWAITAHAVRGQDVDASGGPWVDFLLLQSTHGAADVGPFANTTRSVHVFGGDVCYDVFFGRIGWFLLFVVGALWQIKVVKKQKAQEEEERKDQPSLGYLGRALLKSIS